MSFFGKINSLINLFLGSFHGINFLIKTRKIKEEILLVKLFSSKFGHFYSNTEIFLKENYRSNNYIVFYFEKDSLKHDELIKEIEKFGEILSYRAGYFLFKFLKFSKFKHFDLRDYSYPISRKILLKKPLLFSNDIIKKKYKKFATCSIRNSSYNLSNDEVRKSLKDAINSDNYQTWRDTDLEAFKKAIIKFKKKNNINFFLTNNLNEMLSIKNSLRNNFKFFENNYNLKKIFSKFTNSKFHISSSTGIDTMAFHQNIPTGLFNVALGGGLPSIFYPDKCIILPMNLYSSKKKKIFSIKEYIKLLKKLQANDLIDRFEPEYQKKYQVKYISNSDDEIYNLILETELMSVNKLIFKKEDKILQKKFWEIYEDKWILPNSNNEIFNKKKNQTIISPYYLRKFKNLLNF